MKIGYARAGKESQNTVQQEILMQELGVEKIFVDNASYFNK